MDKCPENGEKGRIFRAGIEIPKGQTANTHNDIEVLFDDPREPIDLEFDLNSCMLYWTDRGESPLGNTVSRVRIAEGEQKKSHDSRDTVNSLNGGNRNSTW